jgi:hypothetical protein
MNFKINVMQNEELEEKITMLEELIQGFVNRMNVVETEMPEFLKTFLQQNKETLDRIAFRIETANKRYDDAKIQQQIDEVKKLVATVPKVIGVKTSHHFGAWSKSLIIGVVACFVVTSLSVGTAVYLNHQNERLNDDAYSYWLVKALYPEVSKTIEKKLADDPKSLNQQAEKEMVKQNAVTAAQAQAEQADKEQKAAKDNLEKVKSGK